MNRLLLLTLSIFAVVFLCQWYESTRDPYEIGMHWSYSIECENGFVYKTLGRHRGTIQILNSDGSPLKCGEKIH